MLFSITSEQNTKAIEKGQYILIDDAISTKDFVHKKIVKAS